MKILITGGTGFVGTRLTTRLLQEGHELTILTRSAKKGVKSSAGITYLEGDPTQKGAWQGAIRDHQGVINLAGASIFAKWTEEHKKAIRESRIRTTQNIVEGFASDSKPSAVFFSTSAVGYYGFCEDEILDETAPPGSDFLARIALEWEGEARKAEAKGIRVVITRFGIVLGEKGGALGQMLPLFRKFLGGPIGSGRQWFSWIHIDDLAEAFVFLLKHPEISGPVNLCSPNPIRNRDLAKAIGKALHRPSFLWIPGFMVKLVLGEFGSVILEGQRVVPRKLLDHGFSFRYPVIDQAIESVLRQR